MTDSYKDKLLEMGVDVPTALARFMGNETLFDRFLKKFLDDENFHRLCEAVRGRDAEAAFIAAHTLKGVAGNLGLDCISTPLLPIVEKLRSGSLNGVEEAVDEMKTIYVDLCCLIREGDRD